MSAKKKCAFIQAANEHGTVTMPVEYSIDGYHPGIWVVRLNIDGFRPFIQPLEDYLENEQYQKADTASNE